MIKISPSLLAADFTALGTDVQRVKDAGCEALHLDVMDGAFVPNISFGPCVIGSLRKISDLVFDTHLMISDPIRYIDTFVDSGADIITVHYESCDNQKEVLDKIHARGKKAGISIKPATPAFVLEPFINDVDLILVMTVNPGFGGQSFMPEVLDKISEIREMISVSGREIALEVDGGINETTGKRCVEAGADMLVSGTYLFKSADMSESVKILRGIGDKK